MMVYCRGCGKEIHETAPTCPSCGAPQNLPQSAGNGSRSTVMLVVMTAGWALIFWIGTLFIGGMFAGALNADDPSGAGEKFGEAASVPVLLISLVVAGVLTKLGKLPGTRSR